MLFKVAASAVLLDVERFINDLKYPLIKACSPDQDTHDKAIVSVLQHVLLLETTDLLVFVLVVDADCQVFQASKVACNGEDVDHKKHICATRLVFHQLRKLSNLDPFVVLYWRRCPMQLFLVVEPRIFDEAKANTFASEIVTLVNDYAFTLFPVLVARRLSEVDVFNQAAFVCKLCTPCVDVYVCANSCPPTEPNGDVVLLDILGYVKDVTFAHVPEDPVLLHWSWRWPKWSWRKLSRLTWGCRTGVDVRLFILELTCQATLDEVEEECGQASPKERCKAIQA